LPMYDMISYLFWLVSRFWSVTFSEPLLKRLILCCASQSAFAVTVNASVDLWIIRIKFR